MVPLLLAQSAAAPKSEHRNLSPKTRPYVELEPFKKLSCVTVSLFRTRDQGRVFNIRVYRFTYKANLKAEVARWSRVFTSKHGWKRETDEGAAVIFTRNVKHRKIKSQALVLQAARWVADPKAPTGTRRAQEPGYVAVSFNETLK